MDQASIDQGQKLLRKQFMTFAPTFHITLFGYLVAFKPPTNND
jgi:hypothetical protein